MTAAELIERLEKLPADTVVGVQITDLRFGEILITGTPYMKGDLAMLRVMERLAPPETWRLDHVRFPG